MRKNKLFIQLAISITALIFAIEGVLLVTSIDSRRSDLMSIKKQLQKDVKQKTGKDFNQLHPGILDEQDIENRMSRFKLNVILLTFLITFCVVTGTLLVFYLIAGKYIVLLDKLNQDYKSNNCKDIPIYKAEKIPNNEIGELIISRNEMLNEINSYQNQLEEKLEQAKSQLVQAAKMSFVGEFTSSIVHDLKNPLSVITMNSSFIEKNWEKLSEEKKLKLINKIQLSANRLLIMIERMGKFNRSSDKDYNKVNFNEIIDNSLLFLKNKLIKNNVEVNLNLIVAPSKEIIGSAPALEQVFSNLVSNACDAMKSTKAPRLEITTESNDEKYIVNITDNGEGIDDENIKNIFESFFTTKSIGEGTGLGLSSTLRIMEEHSGSVEVKSQKGEGTTFSLFFKYS